MMPATITVAVKTAFTSVDPSSMSSQTSSYNSISDIRSEQISSSLQTGSFQLSSPSSSAIPGSILSSNESRTSSLSYPDIPSSVNGDFSSSSALYSYGDPGTATSPLPSPSLPVYTSANSQDGSTSCKIAIAILATAVGIAIIAVVALLYYTPKRWKARGAKHRDEEIARIKQESDGWKGRYELLSHRAGLNMSSTDFGIGPMPAGMGMGVGVGGDMAGSVPMVPLMSGQRVWR